MRGSAGRLVSTGILMLFAMIPVAASEYRSEIEFSGRTWQVRETRGRRGPGPNYFSADERSVRVNEAGELVLSVRQDNAGHWTSAELRTRDTTGYGRYAAVVRISRGGLPSPLVFGFFTYDQRPAHHHREIDIELAPFDGQQTGSLYASVQPSDRPGNAVRMDVPSDAERYYLSFEWAPGKVAVMARPVNADDPALRHTFEGNRVPPAGETHLHVNLWLFQGREPDLDEAQDVVVEWAGYTPFRD